MDKKMVSTLLVTASDKTVSTIESILSGERFLRPVKTETAADARKMFNSGNYEIVIIDTPLTDDFGIQLALDLSEDIFSEIMILTKNYIFDQVSQQLTENGIIAVPKPVDRKTFDKCVEMMYIHILKSRNIRKKVDDLQVKIDELRVIDRAKLVLIEHRGMTEQQAHRFIEKTAMDNSIKSKFVAEKIIENFQMKK